MGMSLYLCSYAVQHRITILYRFKYARFIRIDFGCDGYSYCRQRACDYWNTYKDERDNKQGQLGPGFKCKGDINRLIQVIKEHDPVYNVASNNCKGFSKKVWKRMTC